VTRASESYRSRRIAQFNATCQAAVASNPRLLPVPVAVAKQQTKPLFPEYWALLLSVRLWDSVRRWQLERNASQVTPSVRKHRTQGVWGPLHTVCHVALGDKRPILTTYNQSRQTNHR
jgi:hypothetical protein